MTERYFTSNKDSVCNAKIILNTFMKTDSFQQAQISNKNAKTDNFSQYSDINSDFETYNQSLYEQSNSCFEEEAEKNMIQKQDHYKTDYIFNSEQEIYQERQYEIEQQNSTDLKKNLDLLKQNKSKDYEQNFCLLKSNNTIKNIVKQYFNYLMKESNSDLVSEFIVEKPIKYSKKLIKKYFKSFTYNNGSLVKLLKHEKYGRGLEYYLTFDAIEELYGSKVQDIEEHISSIKFLKNCCVNHELLINISFSKKKGKQLDL